MKNFNCVKLWIYNDLGIGGNDNEKINAVSNILKKYDVKTLEQLALELYENYYFIDFPKEYLADILDLALYERSSKLDSNHVWTDENIREIIRVSELFASACEKACIYAKTIADKLEQDKRGNNFPADYDIEIKLIPYLKGYRDAENKYCGFMDVICKPISTFSDITLTCSYDDNKYFDRSENWNEYPFVDENGKTLDCFKNVNISYAVHELLDSLIWSFQDIINISEICAEVRVKHKLFFGGKSDKIFSLFALC